MMTEQHICEALSRAHIAAIAASAGVNWSRSEFDYGIDGTFHEVAEYNNRYLETGFPLDFQLKASTRWTMDEESITYDLEAKTYNDLARRNTTNAVAPCILILLCLPPDKKEWLQLNEDQLVLKKCCYWQHVEGLPTNNSSSVRIHIPRRQLFSPETLSMLLKRSGETGFTHGLL